MTAATTPCCHPAAHAHRPARSGLAAVAAFAALGVGAAGFLYLHGATLWYAPLAGVALVVVHLAAVLALVALQRRRAAAEGRCDGDPAGGAQPGPCCTSIADAPGVIRWPRRYDWLVKLVTLGGERRLRTWILDLADLRPGDAVLDVGAGTATLLIQAAARVGPEGSLAAVEPSPEMLAHARRKAQACGVTIACEQGTAERLPYPDAAFDVVLCTLVLHHLPEPRRGDALAEMRRVLRPGGRLVVADLDRPRSPLRALTGALSLISAAHGFGSRHVVPDAHAALATHDFAQLRHEPYRGGVVGAVVARARSD